MITYRPHIDGLRAIAVLSVLVYHLDKSLLPGGFVGVDIFFVISGYLISRLIVKELDETGGFSFKRFYIRRARRLFPAMAAMFLLCFVGAYFSLAPVHVTEFAWSAVYAVLSVSNFYFWSTADYFDSVSNFKPLLHTWSLGVEEQFYFIWPLLLFLLYRGGRKVLVLSAIIGLGVASLVLNEWVFANRTLVSSWFAEPGQPGALDVDATAFYLLPFRVFEFAIGAGLIFFNTDRLKPALGMLACVVGLAMIGASFCLIKEEFNFPSYNALLPCVGAALVIISGSRHALAKLLTNPISVGIGLISYSLYLVHWPIIVFYKMGLYRPLSVSDYLVLSFVSILLAVLFYKFIEQPFRKPKNTTTSAKPFLLGSLGAALTIAAISATAVASQGWVSRYPQAVLDQLTRQPEDYIELFAGSHVYNEGDFDNNGKPKVVVIGDSMSADLINAFVQGGSVTELDLTGIRLYFPCLGVFPLSDTAYRRLIPPHGREQCKRQHQTIFDQQHILEQADTVILASYWRNARIPLHISATVEYLRGLGVNNVMVLGQKVQQFHGVKLLAGYPLAVLQRMRIEPDPSILIQNEMIRNAAVGYHYFDLMDQFCDRQGCRQVTDDGYLIVYDNTHLTPQGAAYVGRDFLQTDWFKKIQSSAD